MFAASHAIFMTIPMSKEKTANKFSCLSAFAREKEQETNIEGQSRNVLFFFIIYFYHMYV